jgi:predicted TIM-barrel enzyme
MTRSEILERFRQKIDKGRAIVGAGAGTGLSAKAAEEGGADLIIIYNSGRFRMAGRGSLAGLLPYGDANAIVVEMAAEVVTIVRDTPVLAGVCGTDPFRDMQRFLSELRYLGFAGVQNFPTVGLYDGLFRSNLEETGMSYGLEVEMVRKAHDLDMLTTPYAFNPGEAEAMAGAGADIVVAHLGLTTGGSIGAETAVRLEDAPKRIQEIADAAHGVRDDVIILCHGGPLANPDEARYALENTHDIAGFYGASSMERLPTETAIRDQLARFASLTTGSG